VVILKKYLLVFSYTRYHEDLLSRINLTEEFPKTIIINFNSVASGGSIKNFTSKIMMVFRFFFLRVLLCSNRINISILLPHPEHLLSNYFFFSKKVTNIQIYEDGLLNYIDVKLGGRFKKRSEKRRFISRMLFYQFRSVEGHLSGCQEKTVSRGYFQHPEMLYLPTEYEEIKKISIFNKKLSSADYDIVLFVDQDVEALYGEADGGRLREELYDFLSKYKKVYVKLHHDYVAGKFSTKKMPGNFEVLPKLFQQDVAENIIERVSAGVVCGFTSTALINIAGKYDGIYCYCCVSESHMVMSSLGREKMSELFERFNVKKIKHYPS